MGRHKVVLTKVTTQSDLKGVVMTVASLLNQSPRQAVDMVKNLPLTLRSESSADQAAKLERLFADLHAKVEVIPPLPMAQSAQTYVPSDLSRKASRFSSWRLILLLFLVVVVAFVGLLVGGGMILNHTRNDQKSDSEKKVEALMKASDGKVEQARQEVIAHLQEDSTNVDYLVQKAVVYLGLARRKMADSNWSQYGKGAVPEPGQDLLPVPEADTALTSLYRARRLDRHRGDVLRWLAEIYLQKGLAQEAIPFAKQAVQLEPRNPLFWNMLGLAHQEAGHFGQAELALRNAYKVSPDYLPTWRNLGVLLLYHQQDSLQALEWLRRYFLEDPKDLDRYFLRREMAAVAWAEHCRQHGNWLPDSISFASYEQRRKPLQLRLEQNAKDWDAWEELAWLYAGRGMNEQARIQLQKLVRKTEARPSAWRLLVSLQAEAGQWDGVLGSIQRAQKQDVRDIWLQQGKQALERYYRLMNE